MTATATPTRPIKPIRTLVVLLELLEAQVRSCLRICQQISKCKLGASGACGRDGMPGIDGRFLIHLTMESGAVNTYGSPYNLQLSNVQYIDSVGYKVIEPAADVHMTVSHTNIGGTPDIHGAKYGIGGGRESCCCCCCCC